MTILGSKADIALEQQARKTPGPSLEPALFILVRGRDLCCPYNTDTSSPALAQSSKFGPSSAL